MARNLLGFKASRELGRRVVESLDTATPLEDSAKVLLKAVKDELSTFGGGQPSAPGQAPALQSGEYRRSWDYRMLKQRRGRSRAKARVGTDDPAGPSLEFGRKKGARLRRRGGLEAARALNAATTVGQVDVAPRPHLRPAAKKAAGKMLATFRAKMRAVGVVESRFRQAEAAARRAAKKAA